MAFVLDASVAIAWCFPGDPAENTPYARRILDHLLSEDAIVPEVWAFEIANAIFVACNRRKRIAEPQVADYLRRLKALPIRVELRSLWQNVDLESLSRRHNLAAYDTAYLALARRTNSALATTDEALRIAAVAEGVTLLT